MASVNEPAQPISPKDELPTVRSRYESLFSDQTSPVVSIIPEHLRSSVEKDDIIFDPTLVSIGPFYHGKFPDMEEQKRRILKSMLTSLTPRRDTDIIDSLTWLDDAMKRLETKTRSFYSTKYPKIKYPEKIDFPRMMVYDACFILKMFLTISSGPTAKDDPIFKEGIMMAAIVKDMVKLYNQLPYFVLEELCEKTKITNEPLISLAGNFIDRLTSGLDTLRNDLSPDHLLGLFHSAHADGLDQHRGSRWIRIDFCNCVSTNLIPKSNSFPSVTDLRHSGIEVVKKKKAGRLLEIEYCNGILRIPTLYVSIYTKILMRNVVAYEQSDPNCSVPRIFTSYVTFLDALVNSDEDVEVLRVAGVINHFINSNAEGSKMLNNLTTNFPFTTNSNEEVSKILNSLTTNIPIDMNKGYLADINVKIYRHYCSRWEQFKAWVKRLVSSREGIAYVVTIAALYFTILQTVFAVLAYVYPKPSFT